MIVLLQFCQFLSRLMNGKNILSMQIASDYTLCFQLLIGLLILLYTFRDMQQGGILTISYSNKWCILYVDKQPADVILASVYTFIVSCIMYADDQYLICMFSLTYGLHRYWRWHISQRIISPWWLGATTYRYYEILVSPLICCYYNVKGYWCVGWDHF